MTEVVFASNETSKNAHKGLYHFQEESYIITGNNLLSSIEEFSGDHSKLHVASSWTDILRLALWMAEPAMGDVFILLREIGLKPEELLPFRDADVEDIFPWLYYGRKFDILKKICHIAKVNSEKHIKNKDTRVHCHIISEDTKLIVASTL